MRVLRLLLSPLLLPPLLLPPLLLPPLLLIMLMMHVVMFRVMSRQRQYTCRAACRAVPRQMQFVAIVERLAEAAAAAAGSSVLPDMFDKLFESASIWAVARQGRGLRTGRGVLCWHSHDSDVARHLKRY